MIKQELEEIISTFTSLRTMLLERAVVEVEKSEDFRTSNKAWSVVHRICFYVSLGD